MADPGEALSERTRDAAAKLVARYPVARSALLPLLHLVQAEQGCITDEGITFCADLLGLTKAEVGAVSSFYTMFKREPVGDWLLSVCTNPTCDIAGAGEIYERYTDDLGGHRSEEDGVMVEHAECLGICDAAPVVQVNYEMYGPLTVEEAEDLLAKCKEGTPPPSNWSGEVPGTFTEVSWELSGAADGLDEVWARAARQQVDHEVPPAYRSGETDLPVTHPGGDPRGHGGEKFRSEGGAAPGFSPGAERPEEMPAAPEGADHDEIPDPQSATGGITEEQRPGGVDVGMIDHPTTGPAGAQDDAQDGGQHDGQDGEEG